MKHRKCKDKDCEDKISYTTFKQNNGIHNKSDNALRKSILKDIAEFERKIELGSRVKDIVEEGCLNINGLSREMQEAIEICDKYGQSKSMKKIVWRGWQQEL